MNYEGLLKNVKAHILEKVLNIYYLDFVLFGYDMSPFQNILDQKYKDIDKLNHTQALNKTMPINLDKV